MTNLVKISWVFEIFGENRQKTLSLPDRQEALA